MTPPSPRIAVTRRAGFSAAHFYYEPSWTEAENQRCFKACSNRHGHGHNYEVFLTVRGATDPDTGMVVNLKDLKDLMQAEIVQPLDHRNLNREIPEFQHQIPTLENIAAWIRQRVTPPIAALGLEMTHLKVVEQEDLFVEYEPEAGSMLTLTRRYAFSASHRLFNPTFSDAENWRIFGKCNNPNGHGHNYELEVTVSGEPDPQTGMLVDITALDAVVDERILRHVDHKHLNLDVDFMTPVIPTAENIVWVFWQQLAPVMPEPARLKRLRLLESKNNAAEYTGE